MSRVGKFAGVEINAIAVPTPVLHTKLLNTDIIVKYERTLLKNNIIIII